MSTRGWSGLPPNGPEEAKSRLMDAAIACLQRFGLEKTGVGDIAAAAGITKPTLYAYFESRDDLLHAALNRAGEAFGERAVAHARRFESPGDRIVESMLFALRELPREPGVSVTTRPSTDGLDVRMALRPPSLAVAERVVAEMLGDEIDAPGEVAEVMVRWLLSLLIYEGPEARDEAQLRSLLQRRMLPGLHVESDVAN